jgi:cobalt-zinc-cadmium efflux system outer membrane protein
LRPAAASEPSSGASIHAPGLLARLVEAAWATQPEQASLAVRREALGAQAAASRDWAGGPVNLELRGQTDRPGSGPGLREVEIGLSLPLWRPGERRQQQTLTGAEASLLDARLDLARWHIAQTVREAWWAWQLARADLNLARDRQATALSLSADVDRRVQAGDLARADAHQARSALLQAQTALAEAQTLAELRRLPLQAWLDDEGLATVEATATLDHPAAMAAEIAAADVRIEADTQASAGACLDQHPLLRHARAQVDLARETLALQDLQRRGPTELSLSTTRGRGQQGEAYGQSLTLALRLPLGDDPRQQMRSAQALAELREAEAQEALLRQQLAAGAQAATRRLSTARALAALAGQRRQLADQTLDFFDKSFRLGQTDLPTRLRLEAEAAEAGRQATRSRIELAAALSAWHQAQGRLPQ